MSMRVDRRHFLGVAGATAAVGVLGAASAGPAEAAGESAADAATSVSGSGGRRRALGRRIRNQARDRAYGRPFPAQELSGEEVAPYLLSHTKGLPHDDDAVVDRAAYEQFVRAFAEKRPQDLAAVPRGRPDARPHLNPQVAFSLDVQGPDSHGLTVPAPPRFDGAEGATELIELYWMPLVRDVPFAAFETDPTVAAAAAELSGLAAFAGPREGGDVVPQTLFRGIESDATVGPYVSQFLYYDLLFGTQPIIQRHDTVRPGLDFITTWEDLVEITRGQPRGFAPGERDFATTRYLQTPRDLSHYVHFDESYQAYLGAAIYLIDLAVPPAEKLDAGNPYLRTPNQVGFASFGNPHILTLLAEVDTRALKANLFQQWAVHRRVRPELVGARVHTQLERSPGRYDGLLHPDLLESEAVDRTRSSFGTYLLPQAFPEGSPTSPDYVAGHACVAGACTTILKAFYNEDLVLPEVVVPNSEGTALVPYTGPDRDRLTLGGELNKLAGNLSYGRALGGVHYRSAAREGLRLGEQVAIGVLRDQRPTYPELDQSFSFTSFDGERITI
ncbi:MAG: vanadium-dependent haloperoxidase [Actinomycetales bacterium]